MIFLNRFLTSCTFALIMNTTLHALDTNGQQYRNVLEKQGMTFYTEPPKYAVSETIDWESIEDHFEVRLPNDACEFLTIINQVDWNGAFETFSPLVMCREQGKRYIPLIRDSKNAIRLKNIKKNIGLIPFAKQDSYYWVMHVDTNTQNYTIRCVHEAVPGFNSEYALGDEPQSGVDWIKQMIKKQDLYTSTTEEVSDDTSSLTTPEE